MGNILNMDLSAANWSIQTTWNDLITDDFPLKPRDYIRASEIGKPFLDRYLTMKGVPHTDPYPARVKRIFDCGLIFEDAIERVFRLLGILIDSQQTVEVQKDGMLLVTGHYDQRVGGKINIKAAKKAIANKNTPLWMQNRALELLDQMIQQYPNGLKTLISEIKSVNSMAFWAHKNIDPQTGFFKGYDHHKLQLFTYLMAKEEDEGRLFYVSKDDLTLMETSVYRNNKDLEDVWMEDVKQMTHYYKNNIEPDKADDLVFMEDKGYWGYNWMIERSPYFKLITGKDSVEAWQNSLREELKKRNTALCKGSCGKSYMLQTLNKNKGYCSKCKKKGGETDGKQLD